MKALLSLIVFCGFLQGSQAYKIATEQALVRFEQTGEHRLVGTVRTYSSDGELFSVAREEQNVQSSEASYHLIEEVASNVQAPVALSTRYRNELLHSDAEQFSVSRETSEKKRLPEKALEEASSFEFDEGAPWKAYLDKQAGQKHGHVLLSGKRDDVDLISLLKAKQWDMSEVEAGVIRLTIDLAEGKGRCSLDLDVEDGYRPIRFEQHLKQGDMFRGDRLPTDNVRTWKIISTASWENGTLVSLTDQTRVQSSSGDASGRKSERTVDTVRFGDGVARFEIQSDIPDGTPVALIGSSQVRAEWRDGEIVKVYDSGEVESLKKLSMQSNSRSLIVWIVAITVCIGVIIFALTKRKRK